MSTQLKMQKKKKGPNTRGFKRRTVAKIQRRPKSKYLFPFPSRFRAKLVYSGHVHDGLAGNGTTSNTTWQFRLNSCHDPYVGVTGTYNGQPYTWDEISAAYKRYVVIGAKVEITPAAPQGNVYMLVRPSTVSTVPSDFQLEESRPNATKVALTPGAIGQKIVRYYDIGKIHGVPKRKILDDDLYAASVTSDPSLIGYLNVMLSNPDLSSTSNACPFNIRITYFTYLFDRAVLNAS